MTKPIHRVLASTSETAAKGLRVAGRRPALHLCLLCLASFGRLAQAQAQDLPQAASLDVEIQVQEQPVQEAPDRGPARASAGRRLRVVIESNVDHVGWQARLSDSDIDARELAFEELVSRARWDPQLRLALESWSLDSELEEIAWTARMALRELSYTGHGGGLGWVQPHSNQGAPSGARSQDSIAQMLRTIDVGSMLAPTEGVQPLTPAKALSMYGPRAIRIPKGATPHVFKLDFHPEGVVLTEFIREPQGTRQIRYAAESAQALLKAHPHLREQVPGLANILAKPFGVGSHFQWGRDRQLLAFGNNRGGQQVAQESHQHSRAANGGQASDLRRLGVWVTQVTHDKRAASLLGPGVGLLIERRDPGSVAEDLGLQRGDILFELAGEPLCDPEEISRVLLHQENLEGLEVKILDRSRIERTLVWKPRQ